MVLLILRFGRVLLQKIHSAFLMLYSNGQCFVVNHPPLILFAVCVIFFALILSTLAYYVATTEDIRNPDVSKDWNMFLESFSKLELCILQHNVSLHADNMSPPPFRNIAHKKKVKWRPWKTGETAKHTVSMPVVIQPTREFVNVPHSLTSLSASIYGKYIGYKDPDSQYQLNVTMVIPYNWQPSLCSNDFTACKTVRVNACIQFLGPKALFPRGRGPRSLCAARSMDSVEYRAGLNWQMPDLNSFYYCRHRSMIRVIHKPNPSLTVRLSKDQRRTIEGRLLYTSYILLVSALVVVSWAVVVNHSKLRRTPSTNDSFMPFIV